MCDAVEWMTSLTAEALVADNSDEDEIIASGDADDDEYGFDPKLHIWHPPENPVITEERPDGSVNVI